MSISGEVSDVSIIGGGPTGLFAAFYSGMRQLKTNLIDSLPQLGGQLTALYPEKYIYDVAGFPRITGKDLIARLEDQAFQFPITTHLEETVQKLEREEDGILRLTTNKGIHRSKTVVIAAGMGAFSPKKLDAENLERFEGKGVHYFVPRLADFYDKRVLIIGGGDSAVDWALALNEHAEVTVIHRRDTFRAHEHSVEMMNKSRAHVRTFHELRALRGNGCVEWAEIYDNRTNESETIAVDAVILSLGFTPDLTLVEQWGLEFARGGIRVSHCMETNLPGVYAAGDIADYSGKMKLIATGFGDAATAINNAAQYINPKAKVFPGHSSNRKS